MKLQQKLNEITKIILAEQKNWEKETFKGFKKFNKLELEERIKPLFMERDLIITLETQYPERHENIAVLRVKDIVTKEYRDIKIYHLQKKSLDGSGDDTSEEVNAQAFITNTLKAFYSQELGLMISEPVAQEALAINSKYKYRTFLEAIDKSPEVQKPFLEECLAICLSIYSLLENDFTKSGVKIILRNKLNADSQYNKLYFTIKEALKKKEIKTEDLITPSDCLEWQMFLELIKNNN